MLRRAFSCLAVVAATALTGCSSSSETKPPEPARPAAASPTTEVAVETSGNDFKLGDKICTIGGPARHANLAVFIIHSSARDESDFLTLDEGLKEGTVAISEQERAQVNELCIENRSTRALFVQVGDRLQGGRQDRIVGQSFVVPPRSGKQPIRSYCVEPERWVAQDGQMAFQCTDSIASAPQSVRAAALESDQGAVWNHVAAEKTQASGTLGAPNTKSTLNETLDSEEVKKATRPYLEELGPALQGANDATGVAFALDGKVVDVEVYPGTTLLKKLYPRLLAALAFQAASSKAPLAGEVAVADVKRFLVEGTATSTRREQVQGNECAVIDYDQKVESRTDCGKQSFWSVMKK